MKQILLAIAILSSGLFAQIAELSKGIGLSAGMVSGTGFSYRQMTEKSGFQISFGIMKWGDDDDLNDLYFSDSHNGSYDQSYWIPDTSRIYNEWDYGYGSTWGNLGLTYYRPLHQGKRSMFYTLAGVSMYYSSGSDYRRDYRYTITSESTYTYTPINDVKKVTESDLTYVLGAGIGFELKLSNNIRVCAELPLTFTSKGTITMFIPQIGLHYYYK